MSPAFCPSIPQLYHLAEAENLSSIFEHGLLSTQRLVWMSGLSEQEQASLLRGHRRTHVRLPTGVLVRDQAPMPPSALGPALDDGMDPPDWYALLNGHVFLWPDRARMQRQRKACGSRPQVLLTFEAVALLDGLGEAALVTPINTGNARRRPARRGRTTLLPYQAWLRDGWPAMAASGRSSVHLRRASCLALPDPCRGGVGGPIDGMCRIGGTPRGERGRARRCVRSRCAEVAGRS